MDRIQRIFGIKREDSSPYHSHHVDDGSKLNPNIVTNQGCLECRIIGTTVPIGAAGYILHHYRLKKSVYKGSEGLIWNIVCLGMSSALILIGGCRFFECGIFKYLNTSSKTIASQDDND
ncbi:uncharacterized protein LOC132554294 [Ylistrum balloti]|uniref:uncharacterized protein LOC132554294 n=1 Tax=Ylistrum balloti TaxID=509963 RepID=UPI002905A7EE|nr:uncharacterized protein LOC132554294 [Ylistrum balloti]